MCCMKNIFEDNEIPVLPVQTENNQLVNTVEAVYTHQYLKYIKQSKLNRP